MDSIPASIVPDDNKKLQNDDGDEEKPPSFVVPKTTEPALTVRRMSQNDTWKNMKLIQSSSSLNAQELLDASPPSIMEEPTQQQVKKTQRRQSSLRRLGVSTARLPLSSSTANKGEEIHYIVNDQQSVLDAITSKDRINALLACDTQVLTYNPRRWTIVLQPRGRNVSMIAMPLLLVTLWGIMWILILSLDSMTDVRESIADLNTLISPLLVPVSFLLVFRLGRAAVRFWDARKAIGKIVETCRVLMSTAAVGCEEIEDGIEDDDLLNEFARWTCVFPIAVKNFLRPTTRKGWDSSALETKSRFELGQLVSDEEAKEILNTSDDNFATIYVLNKLRALVWKIGGQGQRDFLYQQLNCHIDILTGAWGACERINSTPLPQVYVSHLRTFLLLYLLLWQMEAAATHSWLAIPTVFAASWGLLGIEAAAVECECPFKYHSNHLPLGKMCVVTARNVAQTVRNTAEEVQESVINA